VSTASAEIGWRQRARTARPQAIDLGRARAGAPLAALLALAAVLYLWGLSRNGFANQYYAAAVQAGTHSWKAFLFGSLDPSNYITVDKPPASLWMMELSSRLLGFSSFSMLLPQALEGIAAVALLYATVRRWFGKPAAVLSGLVLALTPVTALMFRFNNPDAFLVLLLVLAAYGLTRALEGGSTRWLALAGTAIGFAFLAKMMQAFVIVPAFALAYLVAAPGSVRRRIWQLAVAGGALVTAAGWWVALVELWPAGSRPYIGGSTDNSILQLIFGYNGLDRISGGSGPGGGPSFSGTPGILRLFNSELGGQISWLLPAAAIALVAGLVWTARRPRTDRTRAGLLIWGGWFVMTAAVFSFMSGIIHPYYTNMLAPALAVLVGVGATLMWQRRAHIQARLLLGGMLAGSAVWAFVLLDRVPAWHPWLRTVVLAGGLGTALAIVLAGARARRSALAALATAGVTLGLAAPAAWTLSTVSTAQAGQNVGAGPAVASAGGVGAGGLGAGSQRAASFGGRATAATGSPATATTVSRTLVSLLSSGSSRFKWAAATTDWQTAASIELAGGKAVMAIGGFSGVDGMTLARFEALVAAGKIHYFVSGGGRGLGGGGGLPSGARPPFGAPPLGFAGGPGSQGGLRSQGGRGSQGGPGAGRQKSSQIQSWVASHFRAVTVGGTTVYDLTQPKARA